MKPVRLVPLLVVVLLTGLSVSADEPSAEQLAREAAFSEEYSNCVLVGTFTFDGKSDQAPKPERYEIESVKKITGDQWTITAQIKYGNVDLKVPVPVFVHWAGDTPVISLTDARIPLMKGAFSTRVIFHGDRYAGTWQHDKVGGHMFGKIEKKKPEADDSQKQK